MPILPHDNKRSSGLTIGIELINNSSWMGGTIYLANLVNSLHALPESERPNIALLGDPSIIETKALTPTKMSKRKKLLQSILSRLPSGKLSLVDQVVSYLQSHLVEPIDLVYPGFGASVPNATVMRWIPDFQHRYLPHLFSSEERARRDEAMYELARSECTVIISSQTALEDFRRFFPSAIARPRVWSFHSLLDLQPIATIEHDLAAFGLPDKFLYLPNQFWTHKNHTVVFEALYKLNQAGLDCIPVVCTGATTDGRDQGHYESLMKMVRKYQLEDQLFFLGLLARDRQLAVLRRCAAVVQPSLFEGWSTVVEDARAVGKTIFLSEIPVHKEQMNENSYFFDPNSADELAALLHKHWKSLKPGPDPKAEEKAQKDVYTLVVQSARQFTAHCREAVALSRAPQP
jgi:glycosyltransferase involved in cell wall biosynthesis